jgi:5'-3' exonuclease
VPAPLLAVDAPSMLFRAFYALPSKIVGPDGRPVNALLGAANMVLREVELHQPRAVVLCFGPDAAAYRTDLYPAYHAEREEAMPDELPHQFADSRAFFEAFGWIVTTAEDLEADDLLGTYARLEAEAGGHALLLTGDRDMYQCATEDVTVLYVRTGGKGAEEVGPAEVRERYGIGPELVPDFIALRGDPSDGLPGAKGVGPKTAASLLAQYGSLEAALAEGRFSAEAEDLRLYRRIAQMDASAPLPSLADQTPNWVEASSLSQSWGLGNLAGRLEALATA